MPRTDLKSLCLLDLEAFFKNYGLPAFRARQFLHWTYYKYARSIQDITEFSKETREKLSQKAYISNLELLDSRTSEDGTEKFLFGLEDGESIESVLIPGEDRLTLCISTQAGCAMGCRFCLTGTLGLRRNLKPHEIADQVISANRLIAPRRITNIVLMGMGEPLANFDNVCKTLWLAAEYMNISAKRITLSTSGIAPKICELPKSAPLVNLAISLNATTDGVRDLIMPVNKIYPLRVLLDACRKFPLRKRSRITFEYVLLEGLNDTREDAKRLVKLLKGIPSKINLIPYNPCEGAEFKRPEDSRVAAFQDILLDSKMTALIRKSKGRDILAACGQLKAKYNK